METTVKIKWDKPKEQSWLSPENIKIVLSAYCKNTKFSVTAAKPPLPDRLGMMGVIDEVVDAHDTLNSGLIADGILKWLKENGSGE